MSMLSLLAASSTPTEPIYSDSVFSSYTYTGNGSTQTITNGIDLAGEGGLVWTKQRSSTFGHSIIDSARGITKNLSSTATDAEYTNSDRITALTSSGFSVGASAYHNQNTATYVAWTFRKAPKFFDVQTVTKSGGSDATVSMSALATLGMVIVKRTDSTGSWYVWHRSLTAGKLLYLEQTAAEATLGHITVSGTTVTLEDGVIADGSYVVYGYAHDTASDGIIQCGSFTTDGSYNMTAPVVLGWEPQYILMKPAGITGSWYVVDASRGFSHTSTLALLPNTSGAESAMAAGSIIPNATGFNGVAGGLFLSTTAVYIAIRRPNKPPTSGTQVYNAIARAGTGAAATVTGVGFAPDMVMPKVRNQPGACTPYDRLRGALAFLQTSATNAESSAFSDTLTAFGMDGVSIGADASFGSINQNTWTYINHFFRRAPGIFDQICTTGTGANKTEAHNLTVAPELWLHKGRSGATEWVWGSSLLANTQKIVMPSPNGVVTDATAWNSTYPTASVISFGTAATVNTTSATYSTYMWATLAGVNKVFTYTGDGGSGKVIDCGFAAGARFVLIIRITASTAQDIFVWDTVRGIVAGNDPHLSLNTTVAEVTTDDSIDPDTSGFAVNQVAATNINVNGAVYIGLAYS